MAYVLWDLTWAARNVSMRQPFAALKGFWIFRLILPNNIYLFKKLSKQPVTFSQSFAVFFWGAMKNYFQDNCDYTFRTLQNMPKVLTAVKLSTIRKLERHIRLVRSWHKSGSISSQGVQFKEVETTQACRDCRTSIWWPNLVDLKLYLPQVWVSGHSQ